MRGGRGGGAFSNGAESTWALGRDVDVEGAVLGGIRVVELLADDEDEQEDRGDKHAANG